KEVIDPLAFTDRMKLAIRFSDDMGARSIVRDIGFQYMNGALAEEGFADNKRNGILWLGGDYDPKPLSGIMGPPPLDGRKEATWVRANARGIASFLTLVWTNQLVDKASCEEMRDILLERRVGYATNLTNKAPGTAKRTWSKTGILTGVSEGAIIEANRGGKRL